MKSLQESLFDKDLVEKGVSIDFEALRDMLFTFGRKKAKLFDRSGVIYHEGRMSIYLKKFVGINDCLCFELEFGVTNLFNKGTGFNIPTLKTHDRWGNTESWGQGTWKPSRTDVNVTRRVIDKKVELEDNDHSISVIEATDNNIGKVFELYEGMINEFCSKEFEKKLIHYEDVYKEKKSVPGLILDILMKQLIEKA